MQFSNNRHPLVPEEQLEEIRLFNVDVEEDFWLNVVHDGISSPREPREHSLISTVSGGRARALTQWLCNEKTLACPTLHYDALFIRIIGTFQTNTNIDISNVCPDSPQMSLSIL